MSTNDLDSKLHPNVQLVLHHLFASLYLESPQDLSRVILQHLLGGVDYLSEFPVETWYGCSCIQCQLLCFDIPSTFYQVASYILLLCTMHWIVCVCVCVYCYFLTIVGDDKLVSKGTACQYH